MTTDIFIKTCNHDKQYHEYCLQSIKKYCTGFRNTVVVEGEHENGYIYQQVIKMHADEYTDADFILVTDSDTLFNQPVTPESFMADGKPIWYMTPFSTIFNDESLPANNRNTLNHWSKSMYDFCGIESPFEFMRRQPFMFPRYVLKDIQQYCLKTHGKSLKQYPLDKGVFTEWNVLGFYCWLYHRDAFTWINTDDGIGDAPVRQFKIWGDTADENLEEIKQILENQNFEFLQNGQMILSNDTHLSTWAKEHGNIITDPHLFEFLKQYLDEAQCVWDIGANIGDHTRAYLDMGKTVYAFEPNPLAYECLCHNCPDSHNYSLAANSKKGELTFETLDNVGASCISKNGEIKVKAVKLDTLDLPKPDFIKIDIEGWEVNALIGMKKTINKYKPKLFIEINHGALAKNGHNYTTIIDFVKEAGYENIITYPIGSTYEDPQLDILAY
jgi:FkbM family methyltransferase